MRETRPVLSISLHLCTLSLVCIAARSSLSSLLWENERLTRLWRASAAYFHASSSWAQRLPVGIVCLWGHSMLVSPARLQWLALLGCTLRIDPMVLTSYHHYLTCQLAARSSQLQQLHELPHPARLSPQIRRCKPSFQRRPFTTSPSSHSAAADHKRATVHPRLAIYRHHRNCFHFSGN